VTLDAGRIGFRSLRALGELDRDGIRLAVNDVPVFARGAVWTPPDLAVPCSTREQLRPVLQRVLDAGMNMLRIPGVGCYEGDAFYDLCDELGILVWQDFMFANLDYPAEDPAFRETVTREARQLLSRIGGRPSLAVLCGGSEVAQQAAMMGLDPHVAGGPLYEELLPSLIAEADVLVPYVPSTPWGGDLPFRPSRGVANYYGVGAYLRPLEDARRSEVRFAAECLAFSNVPDDEALAALSVPAGPVAHHPLWKAGVPRDVGASWDFDDVRDHYLGQLFGVDPAALRYTDHERYLELSRQVTGEVMAEVLGEWRRAQSPCAGALVLWLKDLRPGAGWGLLDHRGGAKVAFHHVRRALAPVAVWSTDEGLDGIAVHLANDSALPITARLRIAMYRDLEVRVEELKRDIVLEPHAGLTENVEALLGRFVDASFAYRFGPPSHDLIVLSLEGESPDRPLLSQSFRLTVGRPSGRETPDQLGLSARLDDEDDAGAEVTVSSRRFVYGVRLDVPGFTGADDAFSVEPGHARRVRLRRIASAPVPGRTTRPTHPAAGHVTALNLAGRVPVMDS
jgi:beta-mannosidase